MLTRSSGRTATSVMAFVLLASTFGVSASQPDLDEPIVRWRDELSRPRVDRVIDGWRFASVDVIAAEAPSLRRCEPRWVVGEPPVDLQLLAPSIDGVVDGPDVAACDATTMSVSWTATIDTPHGVGGVTMSRMRWDRPAFPVDAARLDSAIVAGAPAMLVPAVDPLTGFGPSQIIVIEDASFDPYATVLAVSGMHVPQADLLALTAEATGGPARVSLRRAPIPLLNEPPPPVTTTVSFLPPARKRASSSTTAKLTDDWHCSRVSGDRCPSGKTHTCAPGAYGQATCSALDWNGGKPTIGENAYVRVLASRSSAVKPVLQALPSASLQTCHVVTVSIVDGDETMAALKFQHIDRESAGFEIQTRVNDAAFTERFLGDMLNERRVAPGCPWSGPHVHEDDDRSDQWSAWNTKRFSKRQRARFTVADPANWTRRASWTRQT